MSTKSLKPITIVMVDDHQLVRIGLRSVLETLPDLELIGEADTGREGVRLVTELSRTSCCSMSDLPIATASKFVGTFFRNVPAPACCS